VELGCGSGFVICSTALILQHLHGSIPASLPTVEGAATPAEGAASPACCSAQTGPLAQPPACSLAGGATSVARPRPEPANPTPCRLLALDHSNAALHATERTLFNHGVSGPHRTCPWLGPAATEWLTHMPSHSFMPAGQFQPESAHLAVVWHPSIAMRLLLHNCHAMMGVEYSVQRWSIGLLYCFDQ
jgi:hypothetical protein